MQIPFVKYQGTGNDFILVDDRSHFFKEDPGLISGLCHRHFGIGSDGLLLLRNKAGYDFEMVYYNPDGSPASFCGNGGRCIVAFAYSLEIIGLNCTFIAADGEHRAEILEEQGHESIVRLEMRDAEIIESGPQFCYLNTGTWHFVEFVDHVDAVDVTGRGHETRNRKEFSPHGTNVNFVSMGLDSISVRTYEKGVEDETLSCGTGVTASAIAASIVRGGHEFKVLTRGGELNVQFSRNGKQFTDIRLTGPVKKVFEGQYSI
jgi:diaminopimelate epimerase